MLKVTFFAATLALAVASPSPKPMNIFKIDISPEEAQQYLNNPPFVEPQLSGRTDVLPLVRYDSPQFRAADAGPSLGHYWKNGHEIQNTEDYVEEVYDASQYHGQDGLGAYAYGYRAPESAKVENRARSGEVQGSYTYKDANNNDIKVRYWADSEGFHQEDNLPKVELKPVQETEEVRQARLAHEKAWQEAADAALHPNAQPPQEQQQQQYSAGNYNQPSASNPQAAYQPFSPPPHQEGYQPSAAQQNYQPAASETQQVSVAAPGNQLQQREGKAFASSQASYQGQPQKFAQQSYNQQSQYSAQPQGQQGAYSQQSSQYSQAQYDQQSAPQQGQYSQQSAPQQGQYGQQSGPQQGQYGQQQKRQYQEQPEEPEPTGPPRGFFYSFDYPVSVILRKDAQGQNGPVNPGTPVDHDTVDLNGRNYG